MNPLDFLGPAIATLGGLAVVLWGLACRAERFPRNVLVGYRTRAALSTRAAWKVAHRAYAPALIVGGLVLSAAGVASLIAVVVEETQLIGPAVTIGIVTLLAALIVGGVPAPRALKRYLEEHGQ